MNNPKFTKEKFLVIITAIAVLAGVGAYLFIPKNETVKSDFKVPKQLSSGIEAYLNMDTTNFEEGQKLQYESAVKLLNEDKDDKEGLMAIASILYSLDREDEAEKILNYTYNKYPDDIIILQNLASVYNGQKRFEDEEKAYYAILEKNIVWMQAFDGLASLYRFDLRPRTDRFVEAAQRARDYDYGDQFESDLLRTLGFYYYYAKDNDNAREYFGLYLKRKPEDAAIQGVYKEVGGIISDKNYKFGN